MDAFHESDGESRRKIGVHINSDFQVALVSSDVTSNSTKVLEQSTAYLDGTLIYTTIIYNVVNHFFSAIFFMPFFVPILQEQKNY